MSAKDLVDGIRREFHIPLPFSRSRDLISRLIYGAAYPSASAAEQASKLPEPRVTQERTDQYANEFGPWVQELAQVAMRHIAAANGPFQYLKRQDIEEITAISEERDSSEFPTDVSFNDLQPFELSSIFSPTREIRGRLKLRIAALHPEALIELKALAWLGRGDHDNYADLLINSRTLGDVQDPAYLAAKASLHRYLTKGLRLLDRAG